jgi:hypothetical protein
LPAECKIIIARILDYPEGYRLKMLYLVGVICALGCAVGAEYGIFRVKVVDWITARESVCGKLARIVHSFR